MAILQRVSRGRVDAVLETGAAYRVSLSDILAVSCRGAGGCNSHTKVAVDFEGAEGRQWDAMNHLGRPGLPVNRGQASRRRGSKAVRTLRRREKTAGRMAWDSSGVASIHGRGKHFVPCSDWRRMRLCAKYNSAGAEHKSLPLQPRLKEHPHPHHPPTRHPSQKTPHSLQ